MFVLSLDQGYDGEACLGVYSTQAKAEAASTTKPSKSFRQTSVSQVRNSSVKQAYFKTVQCVRIWLIAGLFGIEVAEHRGISLVPNVFSNFLLCLFITTLIVPAGCLARWDVADSGE